MKDVVGHFEKMCRELHIKTDKWNHRKFKTKEEVDEFCDFVGLTKQFLDESKRWSDYLRTEE